MTYVITMKDNVCPHRGDCLAVGGNPVEGIMRRSPDEAEPTGGGVVSQVTTVTCLFQTEGTFQPRRRAVMSFNGTYARKKFRVEIPFA